MKLRPEEITSILKDRIQQFDVETDLSEVGTVLQVGDGIARIHGLENCVALERLELEHGVTGIAFNLEEDNVGTALFGEWQHVKEGEPVRRTGEVMSVPVGPGLLGRVVDPLGNPLDGLGPIEAAERRPLEFKAPGVIQPPAREGADVHGAQGDRLDDRDRPRPARAHHRRPLDRQDRGRDRHDPEPARRRPRSASTSRSGRRARRSRRSSSGCATRARWSTRSSSRRPRRRPRRSSGWRRSRAARWASTSSTTGKHALCIYDDLSKHADAYRQLSLLLRRPPGREAFPGDVFYLHSRLLERACKLSDDLGGGSLTALPDHRDAGRRHRRVHPDERHLDHRRPDLPRVEPLLLGRAAGDQRRHVGLARRRQRPDEGDEEGRRAPAPRPRAVPRARGVLAVRLRARRGDAERARPRRADGRDAEPAAVPAVARRGAGRRDLRRDQRLARQGPGRPGAAVPRRAARAPAHRGHGPRGDPRDAATSPRRPRRSSKKELEHFQGVFNIEEEKGLAG